MTSFLVYVLFGRIVDSLQECSHCNDSAVCMTSVGLVNDLVTSLDELSQGHGVSDDLVVDLHNMSTFTDGFTSIQSTPYDT